MQVGTFNCGLASWNRNLATRTTLFCICLSQQTLGSQPEVDSDQGFLLLESSGLDVPLKLLYKGPEWREPVAGAGGGTPRRRMRRGTCSRGACALAGESSRDEPSGEGRRRPAWRGSAAQWSARRAACWGLAADSDPDPPRTEVCALAVLRSLFGPSFCLWRRGRAAYSSPGCPAD